MQSEATTPNNERKHMELDLLNRLTKYPSIPTYHALNERGVASGALQFDPGDKPVIVTEKVDGTNVRLIFTSGDWFIGSRENLLWAKGDRIGDPCMGIVEAMRDTANNLGGTHVHGALVTVVYGELHGGKINAGGNYSNGAVAFRAFDVMTLGHKDLDAILTCNPQELSLWRENGGQPFMDYGDARLFCEDAGIPFVPVQTTSAPPTGNLDTKAWLSSVASTTLCGIDKQGGKAEGVVVRTANRKAIAKIRHDDYRGLA